MAWGNFVPAPKGVDEGQMGPVARLPESGWVLRCSQTTEAGRLMKEELEVIEVTEEIGAAEDMEIILRCRKEFVRLAICGSGIVFGVNMAMASF